MFPLPDSSQNCEHISLSPVQLTNLCEQLLQHVLPQWDFVLIWAFRNNFETLIEPLSIFYAFDNYILCKSVLKFKFICVCRNASSVENL